jgi:hypothetical protein
METTLKELSVTRSLLLLKDGFKDQLASYVHVDERLTELLQELVSTYVEENIPLVNEEYQAELAMMLFETLDIVAR